MDSTLAQHLGISFVVGALCVPTLSLTADRFGSKLAGALAGFPATIAASLLLLGLAEGADDAVRAARVVPMMMGFFGVFLTIYGSLVSRSLSRALAASCAAWLLLATLPVVLGEPTLLLSLAVFLPFLFLSYYIVEKRLHLPSSKGRRVTLSLRQLLFRMAAGGAVVSLSVFLGSVAGPVFGGIIAAFPAVSAATLIVTYESGGASLSAAFAKSLMLNAMINSAVYTSAVTLLYPLMNLYAATALAFVLVCISSFLTWKYLTVRLS